MDAMVKVLRERARLDLERQARPYRTARKNARPPEGWLRAMRLATGFPGEKMARALECDLVYGLAPWHRSLEDRAMELVEQELWRKRYTTRGKGRKAGT